jgi:formamidopyrimidine-DNA glycosylase
VERRSKYLLLRFAGPGAPVALVHLGMTGQLTVVPVHEERQNHTHLVFPLDHPTELRFRDIRRFGSFEWFSTAAEMDALLAEKLGPEPFDLDPKSFRESIRSSIRNLKALLLDQSIVAGVGNIYADEACFQAGLHPARAGNSLSAAAVDRLRQAVVAVLERAIAGRGSTIRNYVGGSGLMGTYQGEFRVYGRTGEPCPVCAAPIQCERLAGRSSHSCPRCQKRA